jgi:hypothetical protein
MPQQDQPLTYQRRNIRRRPVLGVLLCCLAVSAMFGQTPVLTWHNDNARTGQNLQETTLTTANVTSATFGRKFTITADGKVDAQPLYVPAMSIAGITHNVLYVVTEHDSSYAFDADTGALLWQKPLVVGSETPSDDRSCGQVTPEIGATATPVIDRTAGTHGTIYVVAMSKDSGSHYHQRLHALDMTTGAEQFGGPVEVTATSQVAGSGVENTFNPAVHKERAALLLVNGVVYTSWGSHCDAGSYAGWVIGYNGTTLAQVSVLNLVPNGNRAGFWNAGAGPAADAGGNIYELTGNGSFDTSLDSNSFPSGSDYGNAFVKMATTGGPLRVTDYFTMSTTTNESNQDQDLGSGGAMLLPTLNDAQGHPRTLAVGTGKDKHIYVVDTASLGKFSPSANNIYQDMVNVLSGGVWAAPAWFNGSLYYGDVGGTLKAFKFASGLFPTMPTSQSANTFAYPGTIPSVSANGTSNGIVWAAENSNPAVLHAYDASDLTKELYNSNQAANSRDHFGTGNKYIAPMIANGKVYVGTTTGVGVFGLMNPTAANPLQLVPVTPCRIIDTRTANGPLGGPRITGGTMRTIPVLSSTCGIPASAAAYSLNVTVVPRQGTLGYLTIWPAGQTQPVVSTLNSPDGAILANAAIVPAGSSGDISVFVTHDADLVIDINAYFTPPASGSLQFYPLAPCRVLDTRNANGVLGGPAITGGSSRSFPIQSSSCGVPASAAAYSFNLTAFPQGALGYLTAWATGQTQPVVSTLNSSGGTNISNAAIVPAGTSGAVSFFANNTTNLVVDINGYYAPPGTGGLNFYTVTPCRVLDTRNANGSLGGPALTANASRTFPVTGSACGLPATAGAYSLNMTVVPSGALTSLLAWATGQAQPTTLTMTAPKGMVLANAAIVGAGTSGSINVFVSNTTHLVVDANGYFAP